MTPKISRALPVLLACALAASACRTDSPDERYSVRDSAGVHYVEHRTLDSLPVRKAGADAAIRIGAVEGEAALQLDRVLAGAVLSDGRIVLLNAGTHQVRYYDSTGALVASQGAEGDGPEEYRSPTALVATGGDSVVV